MILYDTCIYFSSLRDYLFSHFLELEKELEGASVLIVCLSYSFSSSPFYRHQLLSALSHGVPLVPVLLESEYEPETWLRFLLATVIYTSFTDDTNFERSMDSLSQALTKYGIVKVNFCANDEAENGCLSECISSSTITSWSRNCILRESLSQFLGMSYVI